MGIIDTPLNPLSRGDFEIAPLEANSLMDSALGSPLERGRGCVGKEIYSHNTPLNFISHATSSFTKIASIILIKKRSKFNPQKFLIFLLSILLLFSCQQQSPTHSTLFQEIILDESSMFRGAELGIELDSVKRYEPGKAHHEDLLGQTYEYQLSGGEQLFVEYYARNLGEELPRKVVISIVANVITRDEITTASLYEETQLFLQRRYGPSRGSYGDDYWLTDLQTGEIEVRLRLDDQRKSISLNFIDTHVE